MSCFQGSFQSSLVSKTEVQTGRFGLTGENEILGFRGFFGALSFHFARLFVTEKTDVLSLFVLCPQKGAAAT